MVYNIVMMQETRTCKTCNSTGPITDFATYTKRDGTVVYRNVCRECRLRGLSDYYKKRKAQWDETPPEPVDEGHEKKCNRCEIVKPISEYTRMERGRRTRPDCRSCYLAYLKEWREKNPSRMKEYHAMRKAADPHYYREQNMRYFFKLTIEEFDEMLAAQGGLCAACGSGNPGKKSWSVDHDHACCPGRRSCGDCVRGIICTKCNLFLGQVNDDPAIIQGLIDYLATHSRPKLTVVS